MFFFYIRISTQGKIRGQRTQIIHLKNQQTKQNNKIKPPKKFMFDFYANCYVTKHSTRTRVYREGVAKCTYIPCTRLLYAGAKVINYVYAASRKVVKAA